jgi:hypothetical protein
MLLRADIDVILNRIMIAARKFSVFFSGMSVSLMMLGCPSKHVGLDLMKF